MRQAEAIPVTVEDEDAQKLLGKLAPGLYDRMIEIIESTREGVSVSSIGIRTFRGFEDQDWQILIFDVRVETDRKAALMYGARISDREESLMEGLDARSANQLNRLVSVFVTPN